MRVSVIIWFVGFPETRKTPQKASRPPQHIFLHDKRPSSSSGDAEGLDEEEQERLQGLRQLSEEVELAYDLVQQFARDAEDAHG
jgi:hypothetical protein